MAELPLFPFSGSSHRGPDPVFSRLRAEQPVVRVTTANGTPAWLITRHEDIRTALEDPRLSRAASYEPAAPQFEGLFQAPPGMIISLDPPDHTRLRALAVQAFSPERIEGMRPRVRRLVDELLGQAEKDAAEGPVDLLGALTGPLALSVICELLGVPGQDRTSFHGWIRQFADVGGPQDEAVAAREQLGAYMAGLVMAKTQTPGDDVLSALIAARLGDDRLSTEELIGLGYTLLGAGGDSSASQLANSVLTLLASHRDVWHRLGGHPEEIPAAVEELLRGVNLLGDDTSGLPRIATEDIAIAGVTIPAGDAVFLAFASANRDGAVFTDPDRLDFTRTHNPHLSFGHGAHRCLGGPLARIELAVAIEELTRRYPDARLAVPEGELAWQQGDVNHRLVALPVHLHGDPAA
ncbi:cytochrome P450 [Streptomyces sp. NPDC019396]|uniref:cytochrome P450 n=1 Tax=Streptomyces sp. NPDC019396 TaxID=3154687 RepID=UPI0033F32E63